MADWLRHAEGVNVEEMLDGAPVVTPPGGKLAMAMFPALQWALREAATGPERIILDRLMSAFPDIPCVAEELCEAEGMPACCDRFWAIDPLDGTKEFIARNDEFAVLIALIEEGCPVLGVVHGPALGVTRAVV